MIFKNLKIGTKLILSFVIVASLTSIVSFISFVEFNKLHSPLKQNIPAGLKEIEQTSYLDSLAQKIQNFEQVMTDSVRNYVKTGDRKWKYRYQEMAPKLEQVIKEAIEKGDEEDKKIFSDLYSVKKLFGDMEDQAIKAVDAGNQAQGLELIEGIVYWQLKDGYKEKLKAYAERRGKKYGETLVVTSGKVDSIVQETYKIVQNAIRILVLISVLTILLAIFLGFMISRSISNPIKVLQRGAEVIGRGNLDQRIHLDGRNEIVQLAQSFNEMARKLQESYSGLEDKVREKTHDLEIALHNIEQEKVRYEGLIASVGDGMIATDQEGKITMLNKPAQEMLGFELDEVVGQPFDQVIPSEDDRGKPIPYVKRAVTLALVTGTRISSSVYYRKKNGEKIPVAATVSPIVLNQKTIGAIEIFRDVTREKEIDQMKSEFISTVSHELRTPLTVIREGVSLVMDGILGATTEDQKKFLIITLNDIDRLKRIIDNLLDVSKIEAGKVGLKREMINLFDLARGVAETFSSRAKTKGLEMRTAFSSAGKLEIYIDRDRMIQVFTNLIGNAFKFTEHGYIEISVEDHEKHVQCAVRDTGRGIAEEDLPKMFGKFVQVGRQEGGGEKGTGLGLSIAKGIVNLHGGRIWVESQVGQGTKFIFTIPKTSEKEVFKSLFSQNLKQAIQRGTAFSVVNLSIANYELLQLKVGHEKARVLLNQLEQFARKCLRQTTDIISLEGDSVIMAFFGVNATDAARVGERVKKYYQEFLMTQSVELNPIIVFGVGSYPHDGDNEADLLKAALQRLS